MSSQRIGVQRPTQPMCSAGGSDVESSEKGQTTSKDPKGILDGVAEETPDQSFRQHISSLHGADTHVLGHLRQKRRVYMPSGINPAAFVLPDPPQHKSPPAPASVSPKDARKGLSPGRMTRASRKLELGPEPASSLPHPPDVAFPSRSTGPPCDTGTCDYKAKKPPTLDGQYSRPSTKNSIPAKTSGDTSADRPNSPQNISSSLPNTRTQMEENPCITKGPDHNAGLPWQPLPIKPITMPTLPPPSTDLERAQHSCLHTLHTSSSVEDVWRAFTSLEEHNIPISYSAIHRAVRVISRQRTKTYTIYTRILGLLRRLRDTGGVIHPHEWNILVNAAGQGLRKTTVRHYEIALSIFRDMTKGRAPGRTLELDLGASGNSDDGMAEPVEPDLYTYTTLIGIASRTEDMKCIRHARTLLEHSGILPNRVTHLSLIPYFASTGQLGAVRSTLIRLARDRLEFGLDGINALLRAYQKNYRLDLTMMIYRLLRHNLAPNLDNIEDEIKVLDGYRRQLELEEFLVVPSHLIPNQVTYTTMIQIMAYHGHLSTSLIIFADMLSTLNTELGAPLVREADGSLNPTHYQPTIAIFRAIFLGFCRHATNKKRKVVPPLRYDAHIQDEPGWTLDNLQQLFELFMRMPAEMHVNRSIFYWIITAFESVCEGDTKLVRDVWIRLEGRFKDTWGGNDNRLRKMHASLFPDETLGAPDPRFRAGKR